MNRWLAAGLLGLWAGAECLAAGAGTDTGVVGAGVAQAAGKEERDPDAQAKAEIEKQLARKLTVDLKDTPLDEALNFLRSLTTCTMILDPKIAAEGMPKISLALKEVPLKDALEQIAAAAGAKYYIKDKALFISKAPPEKAPPPAPKPVTPLTEDQKAQARRALENLAHEDYAERENASKRLREMGSAVVPFLEEYLAKGDPDAERLLRVRGLIEKLKVPTSDGELSPEAARLLKRKVSFEFVDTPLEEAAAFLAALNKNKGLKILVDDGLAKTPINLRVNDLELGSAVEWIARLADGTIVKSGDTIKIARK